MAVSLSGLQAGCALSIENIIFMLLVLISVTGGVNLRVRCHSTAGSIR
jgi:hypothetical protein